MDEHQRDLRLAFDRLAAAIGLNLDPHVALNDGNISTARIVLERLGLDPDQGDAAELLRAVADAGHHRMMKGLPISVRAAAVKREGSKRRVWTGL